MKSKKAFDPADKKIWLFTMISGHITLLLGLYQVLFGRIGWFTHPPIEGGKSVMADKYYRFFLVEHPVLMILAIILITMAHGMAKKQVPDQTKYRKALQYFVLALLAILAAMPWPFREVIGRALFPGM